MKQKILLMLAILGIVFISGCAQQNQDKTPVQEPPKNISDWKIYNWDTIEFNYPPTWTAKEIYYRSAAQQLQGETPEKVGVQIFPGKTTVGNEFIAIGGHQISCDASEYHTKCFFISSIANFMYTDSNNTEILKVFDSIVSTLKKKNSNR